jgi:protein associated with RNAse G/E
MWKPGDIVSWRGVYREKIWHAQTTIVVKDSPDEIALALLPGAECMAPEGYIEGKASGKRRWNFKDKDWRIERFPWHTNRLLMLLEPDKYYSVIYFWDHAGGDFLCYYVNFQLPFTRTASGINTLDLDLDLIVHPDYSHEWKDLDDYQKAIENEVICPEWTREIEKAKLEIFDKLDKRQHPFDGSWLHWMPDASWSPPNLPTNWAGI